MAGGRSGHSGADELKKYGNDAYKKEDFPRAAEFYKQASELQPDEPIYLSNLSAAQYECGRYEDAFFATNKALGLVEKDSQGGLNLKLLQRRAKICLQLGKFDDARQDLNEILECEPANVQAKSLLAALQNDPTIPGPKDQSETARRLMALPRYRPAPMEFMEYYLIGQDDANTLLAAQHNNDKAEGPSQAWKAKHRIRIPKKDTIPFDFSALFCGTGDARHLFATLADIGAQMEERKSAKSVRIHLTAIDIHPGAVARELIMLFTLQELSTIPVKQHSTDTRARELLVMLHYMYWAPVMPADAYKTMISMIRRIYGALHACKAGEAYDLPWLYIPSSDIGPIRSELSWWLTKGPSSTPFTSMISRSDHSTDIREGGPSPEVAVRHMRETLTLKKQNAIASVDKPESQATIRQEAAKRGISVAKYKASMRKIVENMSLEDFADKTHDNPSCLYERELYKHHKILCPPEFAGGDIPELAFVFRCMRLRSDDNEKIDQVLHSRKPHEVNHPEDVLDVLKKHWKINVTYLNEFYVKRMPGRQFLHDPFSSQAQMFKSPELEHLMPKKARILYDQSSAFFSAVARAMAIVKDCVRIEMLVGDGYQVMDEIRYKTLQRSPEFPIEYDRIHLSNVPDYVGVHLPTFTVVTPLLKKSPNAYLTLCCLLNSLIWEGERESMVTRWFTMADSYTYSYSGAIVSEIPSLYGMRLDSPISFPGDYHVWVRGEAPQLSRARLEQVLMRIFWKTVAPVKYPNPQYQMQPRENLNIHSWFRLLTHLIDIGYPKHVISEFLEGMLANRIMSNIPPHEAIPIPLASRAPDTPKVPVSTAPFLAELQTATALWLPRLGLNICSPLPALNDLVRYSVVLNTGSAPSDMFMIRQHKTLLLCFGLPYDMNKSVHKLRDSLVGSFSTKTSLEIVTALEWDAKTHLVTFLLPLTKAEEFMKKGYEVGIVDYMFWRPASAVAPCTSMVRVGSVDEWDRTIPVPEKTTRWMAREDSMLSDVHGLGNFASDPMASMTSIVNMMKSAGLGGDRKGGFPGIPPGAGLDGAGGSNGCPTQ